MISSDSDDDSDSNFQSPWTLNHDMDNDKGYKGKSDEKLSKTNDSHSSTSKMRHQKSFGWEIVEGLKENSDDVECPKSVQGMIFRRRKWPMKGWSKMYVILENGLMAYSKSSSQIAKRHFHGEIDLGLSIVTYKAKRQRIDIDSDNAFYHLKVKDNDNFEFWVKNITSHRLFRQWELMKGNSDNLQLDNPERLNDVIADDGSTRDKMAIEAEALLADNNIRRSTLIGQKLAADGSNRVAPESKLECCHCKESRELVRTITLAEEVVDETSNNAAPGFVIIGEDFKLIQNKMNQLEEIISDIRLNMLPEQSLSASNPSLHGKSLSNKTHGTISQVASPNISHLKVIQFKDSAEDALNLLKSVFSKIAVERDNIASAASASNLVKRDSSISRKLLGAVKELTQQNNELRGRLNRIAAEATISYPTASVTPTDVILSRGSLSASTTEDYIAEKSITREKRNISTVTASEMFYDAAEFLESDTGSSISETDEIDEISDVEEESPIENVTSIKKRTLTLYQEKTGRRDKLPSVQPDISQFSFMNLLCKNIGRDLSKVRLPVILNEPLSVLQMLCEELEYSDLLDHASKSSDPLIRMSYIVAFGVSCYASSLYRAMTKPFNPLIGETYEYVRPDRGWKFIAEQVSHHPPISVCFCESDNWSLWQEFRLKNKFWGKSIEAIPTGSIRLHFKKDNDIVEWNKVTTCIYNIFGQNRYVDHYGDMNVTSCLGTTAKITFHKANSWSHQKYEVSGCISTIDKRKRQIFGKWNEGIYAGEEGKCIWRPGAMPENFDKYYGFSKFTIDLNNIDTEMAESLPKTDSRFRPDQRFLEQGLISEAEAHKTRVEELQRERIKQTNGDENWIPLWFRKVSANKSEEFQFTNQYWVAKEKKFKDIHLPVLW